MNLSIGRISHLSIKTVAFLALVAFAALLIAACDNTPQSAPAPSSPSTSASSAPAPAPAAQTAQAPAAPAAPAPAAPAVPAAPAAMAQAPASNPSATPASATTGRVSTSAPVASKLNVVSTTNFVGDWVKEIGGDRVDVFSLLPIGSDPHTFTPGARDVARVADADVVMTVGLGLEAAWLEELLHNVSADESKVVALGDIVDPIEFSEHGAHDDHDDHMDEHDEDEHDEDHEDEHDEDHEDDHGDAPLGRLLVGDGEAGNLSVIDLETGEVRQDHFDLGARAGRIYSTKSGRYAVAVSPDANTAHLFDGGIFLEPHGDHFDLVEGDIRKLPIDLSGDRPVHLYVGGEWATIFYDGSGDIVLVNEHELEELGSNYVPSKMNVGPQHGAAVPLEGDLFATTIKDPEYPENPDARSPIGAEIRDLNGNTLYGAEGCEGLHGDAGNGHMAAFGCVGGVLVLEAHDGEYSHVFVSAPEGAPEDFRLTSVWGYYGLDHFFALGSAVGLYIVEPEEGEMEQLIPSTEALRPIQVSMGHGGERLFVVMSDGELRMYDAHDLDLLASNAGFLTTPVEPGFWARPHLATADGAIFITDSVGGEVLQLDEHDLDVVNHWDVEGNPTKIAFVGIVGESDGHEEHGHDEHDEDHEDEHDEDHADEDEHEHDEDEEHEDAHAGHHHGPLDPHFWFDPIRVKIAVNDIAARLSVLDPDGRDTYMANAAAYNAQLDAMHAWAEEQLNAVPTEHRLLVTSHDTLSYFAKLYDFEVVGVVLTATDAEPSPSDLAELSHEIDESGVPAIFGETTVSERLAAAVADETGVDLVRLYSGSLGIEGSGADTYIGMFRANVERIAGALQVR